jgi:hypothetical protein
MADCSNNVTLSCAQAGAGGLANAASQVANATQVGAAGQVVNSQINGATAGFTNVGSLAGLSIDPRDPDAAVSVGVVAPSRDPLDAGL